MVQHHIFFKIKLLECYLMIIHEPIYSNFDEIKLKKDFKTLSIHHLFWVNYQ
jgi:hypothetical protein